MHNFQPNWKVAYVDEDGNKKTVYLNWTSRTGLRRDFKVPRYVSSIPAGRDLAHDHPIEIWFLDASRCLVKGDEAYFFCIVNWQYALQKMNIQPLKY